MISKDEFQKPSAAYRGKPFWAWNGELDRDELSRQIEGFYQMGFGGYFCHSRTGLETEYLGKDWLSLIDFCAEKGQSLGMETWLYDEDRWPSGSVGGMLTQDPEYAMKFIRMNRIKSEQFRWEKGIFAAFSVELDENEFWNKHRLMPDELPPSNVTVLYFTIEKMADDGYCNNQPYADTLSRKTAERFIELTYEKYRKSCGSRFGNSIKGIFTDEPHRGAVMCGTALNNPNAEYLTPYTELLFPYIRDRFNIDLTEYLPELFLRKKGEEISRIKWIYMETLTSLFCENFLKPIYEWCNKYQLIFTGHLLHEDTLTAQAAMMGSLMRGYEFFHYPGLDSLGSQNKQYWAVKQVTSVARQLGKKKVLSELYGCTGWHMNFEDYKVIGDWQSLMGVSLRCPHLSWYTMKGENKRDYPASFSMQSAWWQEFHVIEDYFSRIHVFLDCPDCCDTLVINPIESIWCEIEPKWSYFLEATGERAKQTEARYQELFHYLYRHHIEFDYADEDILKRYYSVETEDNTVYLRVGECRYKTVLLYGLLTIRQSTLDILHEFAVRGGKIIFVGNYPLYVDAQRKYVTQSDVFEHCSLENLKQAMTDHILLELTNKTTGKEAVGVFTKIKASKADGELRLMLLNMEDCPQEQEFALKIKYSGAAEGYDPRTGNIYPLACFCTDNKTELTLTLHGKEEKLILLRSGEKIAEGRQMMQSKHNHILPIKGTFAYTMSEKNLLPLDIVSYQIEDGPQEGPMDILKADRKIRSSFHLPFRGGDKLQPWFIKGRTEQTEANVELTYTFGVAQCPKECRLIMEQPDRYMITINGQPYPAVSTDERWVDVCFRVLELDPRLLRIGTNEIKLKTAFRPSLDLEAIYLYGDFGVRVNQLDTEIIALPERLQIDDLTQQGLPFYGAGITYILEDIPQIKENQRLLLQFDRVEAAYVKLSDGKNSQIMAFSPYSCDITDWVKDGCDKLYIQVMLNRRNTFGPLHMLPVKAPAIGPEHFLTEGEAYCQDGYSLVPQSKIDGLSFVISE